MKMLIFAALAMLAFSVPAKAQMQTYVMYSSCTYSGVQVSTGLTVLRIDNRDKGTVSALNGRVVVRVTIPASPFGVYVGYDASISTNIASSNFARPLSTGTAAVTTELFVPDTQAIYALAADAAGASGQRLSVEQCKPRRQNGE